MVEESSLCILLKGKDYSIEKIDKYLKSNKTSRFKLIKTLFKFINSSLKTTCDNTIILNAVECLCSMCSYTDFDDENINSNKYRIKKARTAMLYKLLKEENEILRLACNKLDEIVLSKAANENSLIEVIKYMIDVNEDPSAIKKVISVNKGCILNEEDNLFEYVFNKAIDAVKSDSYLITYCITLLKIMYYSELDKQKYVTILNQLERNPLYNEIYNIVLGNKRSLNTEEIIDKYNKRQKILTAPIIKPTAVLNDNDRIITIDCMNCQIRDDGISIRKDGNNYVVGIHISDVGGAFEYDGTLDIQARNAYKKSYLRGPNVDIMPKGVSTKLSLDKSVKRGAISLYVIMNDSGDIIDYYITNNSIIVSNNLNYIDVDNMLDNKSCNELKSDLDILFMLANALKQKSIEKEQYWQNKSKGKSYSVIYDTKSHLLIGELSVLYNKLLAEHAHEKGIPYIYRGQKESYVPDLIQQKGIIMDNYSSETIKSVFLEGYYSSEPVFHHGLHLPFYCQISSPLRRYSDIYDQYLYHKYVFKNKDFNDECFEQMVDYLNEREFETRLFEEEYNREALILKKRAK